MNPSNQDDFSLSYNAKLAIPILTDLAYFIVILTRYLPKDKFRLSICRLLTTRKARSRPHEVIRVSAKVKFDERSNWPTGCCVASRRLSGADFAVQEKEKASRCRENEKRAGGRGETARGKQGTEQGDGGTTRGRDYVVKTDVWRRRRLCPLAR